MSLRISQGFKALVLASAVFGMVACGSDNNNNGGNGTLDPGTGTGNPSTDTQTTSNEVQATTQTGVQQAAASSAQLKLATVDTSVACSGGGTAQVTGEVNSGSPSTFDLDFDLDGCTNLDGVVNVNGQYNLASDSYEYSYTITGEVGGNGCIVTFTSYLVDISIPDFTNPLSYTLLLDGAIGGECTGGDTTCDYDNVTVENGVVSGTPVCN